MIYQEFLPPKQLEPFVKCIWLLETNGSNSLKDQILPDAYTELIVHYGLNSENESASEIDEDTIFAGQIRSAFCLQLGKSIGMIGVRFKAEGASCFLKDDVSLTTDSILPLGNWSPTVVSELEERIWSQISRRNRVAELWNFLEEKLSFEHFDKQIACIASFVRAKKGNLEVSNLLDQINLGQRQVERRFKNVVGLSMKEYNRIIRFKEAVSLLDGFPQSTLVDIALSAGYYDQAHFNREFKSWAGQSPTNYLKNPGELNNLYLEAENVENLQ